MMRIDPASLVEPRFMGIPYALGKATFEEADCIGVCLLWLAEKGLKYEYRDKFGPVLAHWWEHRPRRFLDAVLQYGTILKFSEIKKFDVLLLFGGEEVNQFPTMLGVMVDDRHFLTSTEERGSEVFMLNVHWKNKYFGAIRLHKAIEAGLIDGN